MDFLARAIVECGLATPTIALLTGAATAVFAFVILYLHHIVLREESWAQYFGWAFGLFSLQYFLPALAGWAIHHGLAWPLLLSPQQMAHLLCSPTNNLCILAAARTLEKRPKVLPTWMVGVALLSAAFDLGPASLTYRLPDAIFSAFCLGSLGLALYRTFQITKRRAVAWSGLVGFGVYGALNILFALNPVIVNLGWFGLAAAVGKLLNEPRPAALALTPLACFDYFVFAAAFFFKILLFLAAMLLFIKSLLHLSPESARGLLDRITARRGRFLDAQGILRALAESVEADLVALCIRHPETANGDVAWMRWVPVPPPGVQRRSLTLQALPPSGKSIVARIMRQGLDTIECPDLDRYPEVKKGYWSWIPGMRSFVAVPIWYHGAVVACLNIEWRSVNGYTQTTIKRIQQVAALLAPTIASRRHVVSIYELVARLRNLKTVPDGATTLLALRRAVQHVQNVLSPLAATCSLQLGFRQHEAGCNDHRAVDRTGPDKAQGDSNSPIDIHKLAGKRLPRDLVVIRENLKAQEELRDAAESSEGFERPQGITVGTLTLALERRHDPPSRPSMADEPLHRRIVASLVAESLLEAARSELNAVLDDLQTSLNREAVVQVQTWFEQIAAAQERAGLLWTCAVVESAGEKLSLGEEPHLAVVRTLAGGAPAQTLVCHALPQAGSTSHVLGLRLRDKAALWIGIGNPEWGPELDFSSPWKTYLDRLESIAGSALNRIENQSLQRERSEMADVAIRIDSTGMVMHSLRHEALTLAHLLPVLRLEMQAAGPVTDGMRDDVTILSQAAKSFAQMAQMFSTPIISDSRTEIPLREATDHVRGRYGSWLDRHAITLLTDIPPGLQIGVPLDVAQHAIATLVVNAAEAIERDGTIAVQVASERDQRGRIVCRIVDSGPGIPGDRVPGLFRPNLSLKSNGSGVGLSIARRLLNRVGADIEIESGQRGATTFKLLFPATKLGVN